jgi:CcmD family protein
MFLQEATPDTSGYLIAGYAVAFIVMFVYVLSIYVRSRNLNQDLSLLEEMDKSDRQAEKMASIQAKKGPVPTGSVRKKAAKK